jgi:hypothetical protein
MKRMIYYESVPFKTLNQIFCHQVLARLQKEPNITPEKLIFTHSTFDKATFS